MHIKIIIIIIIINKPDSSLYFLPPSLFAVPVHTLQSPIYTSSSPSAVPFCQWPVAFLLLYFPPTVGNPKFSYSLSEMCPKTWKNRHIWHSESNFAGHCDRVP